MIFSGKSTPLMEGDKDHGEGDKDHGEINESGS